MYVTYRWTIAFQYQSIIAQHYSENVSLKKLKTVFFKM